MITIAHIENDYKEKFGIPRQPGLVPALSRIVFEPAYRREEALRGLEGYSHLWLLWQFSEDFASRGPKEGRAADAEVWSPTVRPPRLGGNTRVGIFATRSPNRPNPIGLSSVKLIRVEQDPHLGPVLWVEGADLMDGTPIYDVKPYVPYTDCHPEATGGFAAEHLHDTLQVDFPADRLEQVPSEKRQALLEILRQDPRPSYQEDPKRVYGLTYGTQNVQFTVSEGTVHVMAVEDRLDQ